MDLLWKFEEDCLKNEGQNKLLVNKNSLYGVFFCAFYNEPIDSL